MVLTHCSRRRLESTHECLLVRDLWQHRVTQAAKGQRIGDMNETLLGLMARILKGSVNSAAEAVKEHDYTGLSEPALKALHKDRLADTASGMDQYGFRRVLYPLQRFGKLLAFNDGPYINQPRFARQQVIYITDLECSKNIKTCYQVLIRSGIASLFPDEILEVPQSRAGDGIVRTRPVNQQVLKIFFSSPSGFPSGR